MENELKELISKQVTTSQGVICDGYFDLVINLNERKIDLPQLGNSRYFYRGPEVHSNGNRHIHIFNEHQKDDLFAINFDGTFHDKKRPPFLLSKGFVEALRQLGIQVKNIDNVYLKPNVITEGIQLLCD